MNLLKKFIGFPAMATKSDVAASEQATTLAPRSIVLAREIGQPLVAGSNFMELFRTVPEVFWPIHFIASRVAGAHFELKKASDDSVVWCNRRFNGLIAQPNCLMGWQELVYTHFVYKLATGNAFLKAAMSDTASDMPKYKYCRHFWPLPSDHVFVQPIGYKVPLFGVADKDEIIDHYIMRNFGTNGTVSIPPYQIWHDRDGQADMHTHYGVFLKSKSRLQAAIKPISNLIAVYEARNVIYVKRGGLGFLVSRKTDETGTRPMTPGEKKDVLDQITSMYGVGAGQYPMGLTDVPMDFIRTNLSIADLQPFEETLEDAVKIAAVFGIPAVLVPRKDQSTFSNQSTAEKSVYSSVIIPMAKKFCDDLTVFLGLDRDHLYIDCNFSDVDCLQEGMKNAEEVKKLQIERAMTEFNMGLRTLNDIRAMMHESQIPKDGEGAIPLFSKLKFEMTPDELATVEMVMGGKSPIEPVPDNGQNNQQNQSNINISNTSTGEVNHEREDEKPGI